MPSFNLMNTSLPPIPDYVMHIHAVEGLQEDDTDINAADPSEPGGADYLHEEARPGEHELHMALHRRMESLVENLEEGVERLAAEHHDLQNEINELSIEHGQLAEDYDELREYAEDRLDEVEDLQDDVFFLQNRHFELQRAYGRLLAGFQVEREVVWELEQELGLMRIQAANQRENIEGLQSALNKAQKRQWWSLMLLFVCVLVAAYFCLLAGRSSVNWR
ncbi:uncharacterized protein EKO05_0006892 [Ascochyta rabiei]|uniref:Uncharacterized protein n=1 Tax=Didymella rabiei TaxID=5454 RepID=A0A162Z7G8_DIDRA|nr:uncharacterized protein EKO05_0006892 [Ascochyta rabiei]KZM20441.1 hypothetical protein ST47_g8536 [Ascochyta rabiei]UPX16494.1 hypothetical protein EKO05_0006892 [Ascochyta rabiei]